MKKYDLEKNKKRIKGMKPGLFEAIFIIVSFSICGLCYELDFEIFGGVNALIFFTESFYCVFWFIDLIIYMIIYKKNHGTIRDCLKDDPK